MTDLRILIGREMEEDFLNGDFVRPTGLAWEKRWNYEGWMLLGIEIKNWIEDETAEALIRGYN